MPWHTHGSALDRIWHRQKTTLAGSVQISGTQKEPSHAPKRFLGKSTAAPWMIQGATPYCIKHFSRSDAFLGKILTRWEGNMIANGTFGPELPCGQTTDIAFFRSTLTSLIWAFFQGLGINRTFQVILP